MACSYVPTDSGLFCAGWSRDEIVAALKVIDDSLKTGMTGSGNLTSASLNGKSFTFATSTTGISSFAEMTAKKNDLLKGLAMCDGKYPAPSNRAVAVFPSKVSFGYPYCDPHAA